MRVDQFNDEAQEYGVRLGWKKKHPHLHALCWPIIFTYREMAGALSVAFAQWPSMHDPVKYLLNASDAQEADKLTERWVEAKLRELNYVGLTVCS